MIARWQSQWNDYWSSFTYREQIAATVTGGVALLGLLAWPVFHYWAGPRLHEWRVERAMIQAAEFDAALDYRNLLLSVRRASQLGSKDIQVWRRIATYLTKLGDPHALSARKTVVQLAPDDLFARVELAETALLFGDYAVSQDALADASSIAPGNDTYQKAAATLSLYLGDIDAMKAHLARLIEFRPEEVDAQFDLAAARLWSADSTERELGVKALLQLLATPHLRIQAALALLKHSARVQDGRQLHALLPVLIKHLDFPAGTNGDRMDLPALILGLKHTAAARSAEDVALVANWLAEIRLGNDALQWTHSLPKETSENAQVRAVAAEIAIRENLPIATSFYLLENALGKLPPEAAVLAVGAHQLDLSTRLSAAQASWDEAINIAAEARHPDGLRVLAQLSSIWGKDTWTEQVLRLTIKRSPDAFWAYAALRDQFNRRNATHETWKLYQEWVTRDPDNPTVVSQWMRLGSCLPFARDEVRRRAPEFLKRLPESPLRKAAQAGLLWLQEEPDAARDAISLVGDAVAHNPDVAFWAALINQPKSPNEAYPALARLILLDTERNQLTSDETLEVGFPRSRRASAAPSLRVR